MLAAVTELLAARGYRGFGVGDIATRAGVSLGTFYDCFESKDACVFAGYDRFIEVLLTKMAAVDVPDDDRPALTAGLLGAYLFGVGGMPTANYITGPTYLLNWGITTTDKVDFSRVRTEAIAFTEMILRLGRTPRGQLRRYTL